MVALCAAWLVGEVMLARAQDADLDAHQMQWNCWDREGAKVPRCVAVDKLGPDDADFCEEAVAACAAAGVDAQVRSADENVALWWSRTPRLRFALFLVGVGLVAWLALIRPIARRVQKPNGA